MMRVRECAVGHVLGPGETKKRCSLCIEIEIERRKDQMRREEEAFTASLARIPAVMTIRVVDTGRIQAFTCGPSRVRRR